MSGARPFRLSSPDEQRPLALGGASVKPPALRFGVDDPPTGKPGGTDAENARARDELIRDGINPGWNEILSPRRGKIPPAKHP